MKDGKCIVHCGRPACGEGCWTHLRSGSNTPDALRHKLIADLIDLPIWERGKDRVVTPPWHTLTVEERDLIAGALKQWKRA